MMSVRAARVWIAAIGALLVCAGCGFKGPLYLPERNGTVITGPGQTGQQPAPSAGQTQTPAAKSKSKTSSSPPPASALPQSQ